MRIHDVTKTTYTCPVSLLCDSPGGNQVDGLPLDAHSVLPS